MNGSCRNEATQSFTRETLSEKEWDFNAVPADEIEACYLYEYGREYYKRSPVLHRLREKWQAFEHWQVANAKKKPRPAIPKKHELGFLAPRHAGRIMAWRWGYTTPFDLRTFPDLSWQDLRVRPDSQAWPVKHGKWEAEERRHKLKCRSDRFHIETLAQLQPANIKSLSTWIGYHEWFHLGQGLSNTEYGFFAINWDHSLPEIQRAFGDWLQEQAGERIRKPKFAFRSRGQEKDKLRWLGAFRVRHHYRKRDLVDHADSKLKIPAPYHHYPDLVEAAKKAEDLLAEMFPSEDEAAQLLTRPIGDGPVIPILPP